MYVIDRAPREPVPPPLRSVDTRLSQTPFEWSIAVNLQLAQADTSRHSLSPSARDIHFAVAVMAPKRGPKVLPKPLEDMLAAMRTQGVVGNPTAADIGNVPHPIRAKTYTAMAADLKKRLPAKAIEFGVIEDPQLKREWIAAYYVDPESGGNVVVNETARKTQRVEKTLNILLTQEQLSGANFLNSVDHAKIMCESGELTAHKHRRAPLADAGVMEYEWEVSETHLIKLVEEGVISRSEASLSPEHVDALSASIRDHTKNAPGSSDVAATGPKPAKFPKKLARVVSPAEELELANKKEADKGFNKAKTDVLSQMNKMKRSLAGVQGTLDALAQQDWGGQAIVLLTDARAVQEAQCERLNKAWTTSSTLKFTSMKIHDVNKATEDIKAIAAEVETGFKHFLSKDLAEFSSLKVAPEPIA